MMDILKKIFTKEKIKIYIIMIISLMITAVSYNMFLVQLNIVAGGTNGIAIIIKHLLGIEPSISLFVLMTLFLIISRIFLGREKTLATVFASLVYPAFVKLTSPLVDIITFSTSDMFIVAIFAGLLTGLGNGLLYKTGYNSGGLSVLCQIIHERFHISLAKCVLLTNLTVILVGAFFFGVENAMYATILLYISNIIMDKVLLGISHNKAFYIVTKEHKRISEYIINTLGHSITTFNVKGGFFERKRYVILTVIPSREYYIVKEGIKMIDADAFFVATDSYEVKGAD